MSNKYDEFLLNLDAEASMLLGSFDSDSKYIIDEKIKKELILSNKLIESYKSDIITATASIGSYKFNFFVYIQDGENNLKRAGLFLEEKSKLGFADKTILTYLDSIILPNNGGFFNQVKSVFHLFTKDESEGVDMANNNLSEILNKLNSLKGKYNQLIPFYVDIDKKYVSDVIALLKSSGRYGEMILIRLKKMAEDKKLNKKSPNYWRELKNIIDILLKENVGVFDGSTLQKIDSIRDRYVQVAKDIKVPEKAVPSKPKKKPAPKKKSDDSKPKKKPDASKAKNGGSKDKKSDNSLKTIKFSYEPYHQPQPTLKTKKKSSDPFFGTSKIAKVKQKKVLPDIILASLADEADENGKNINAQNYRQNVGVNPKKNANNKKEVPLAEEFEL